MTYKEFLKRVAAVDTEWIILPQGDIVMKGRGTGRGTVVCPYLAVIGMGESFEVEGLTPAQLFLAADKAPGHDPQIRYDLLVACRLVERPEVY